MVNRALVVSEISYQRCTGQCFGVVVTVIGLWNVVIDADEEAFEDNAEEYMRRDVEGSGVQQTCCVLFVVQ